MKNLGTFSGGKDSLAVSIWLSNNVDDYEIDFCDTGWEEKKTYQHIKEIGEKLGKEIVVLKNQNFTDLIDLFVKKKRAASAKGRFCTEEMKVKPMIDYILSIKEDVTVYQGVRAEESEARRNLKEKDEYFKFYLEPYGVDKKGRPKYHTYRKKDVLAHLEVYSVDVVRPILKWGFGDVFAYIYDNGFRPNPLYFEGFGRVGCFPCVMCTHGEIMLVIENYPDRIQEIKDFEANTGRTFFPPNYIPKRYCSKKFVSPKTGKYTWCPTIDDVIKYLMTDPNQVRLFEKQAGCISVYNICEKEEVNITEHLKAHYNI